MANETARLIDDLHLLYLAIEVAVEEGKDHELRSAFNQAHQLINSIEVNWIRTEALRKLAILLGKNQLFELALGVFEQAIENSHNIVLEGRRTAELEALAEALAEFGYFEKALETAQSPDIWLYVPIISRLALKAAIKGQEDWARKILTQITVDQIQFLADESLREEVCLNTASTFAYIGEFDRAYASLGEVRLEKFLKILGEWIPAYEKHFPNSSQTALQEAKRIASWYSISDTQLLFKIRQSDYALGQLYGKV